MTIAPMLYLCIENSMYSVASVFVIHIWKCNDTNVGMKHVYAANGISFNILHLQYLFLPYFYELVT